MKKTNIAKITKLSDNAFNGKHPNGINTGYTKVGLAESLPQVGERFCVGAMSTSPVTEIIDENTFKTTYSTYELEWLKD